MNNSSFSQLKTKEEAAEKCREAGNVEFKRGKFAAILRKCIYSRTSSNASPVGTQHQEWILPSPGTIDPMAVRVQCKSLEEQLEKEKQKNAHLEEQVEQLRDQLRFNEMEKQQLEDEKEEKAQLKQKNAFLEQQVQQLRDELRFAVITDFDSAYEAANNKIDHDSSLDHKKNSTNYFGYLFATKNPTPAIGWKGLANAGNTCFMNATLQALFHCPRLTQLFRKEIIKHSINNKNSEGTNGVMTGCFAALVDLALSGKFKSLQPRFFVKMFGAKVNAQFADGQQHDALEFQIFLLKALSEDIDEVAARDRSPVVQNYSEEQSVRECAEDFFHQANRFSFSEIKRIFDLTTICTLQCKSCAHQSIFFEQNFHISVELSERTPKKRNHGNKNYNNYAVELGDCLESYFSPKPMDCIQCKRSWMASRTIQVWRCPDVLIIQLKRFQRTAAEGNGQDPYLSKIDRFVRFPVENFDLGQYMHLEAPKCNSAEYELFAVTNHCGTLAGGHYTSYVKNIRGQEEWLEFNDLHCNPKHKDGLVSKDALVLYYILRN